MECDGIAFEIEYFDSYYLLKAEEDAVEFEMKYYYNDTADIMKEENNSSEEYQVNIDMTDESVNIDVYQDDNIIDTLEGDYDEYQGQVAITAVVGGISLGQWIFSAAVTIVITKQIYDVIVRTPNKYPGDYTKLKNGQGYKDRDGNIWKKDQLHKDHWDVSNKKGEKVKEVDYNGKQIWPGGAKNKNKK